MNEQPMDPENPTCASECAAGACRFLGYYSDRTGHAGQPDGDNYCHISELPFAVPLDYQASACLGGGWPHCAAYRRAMAAAEEATLPRYRLALAPRRVALLIGVVICLGLAAYYAIRPGAGDGPGEVAALSGVAAQSTPRHLPAAQIPTRTPTRDEISTRTATPTEAPTRDAPPATVSVADPMAAASSTATDTPIPAETELPAAADPPQPATAPPAPTETPTATTAPITLAAPQLVSPSDGQTFGSNDTITLNWGAVPNLPADAYYVVTLAYTHLGATWYDEVPWTRETSWILSEHRYLLDLADHGLMTWSVQVTAKTGEDEEGNPLGTAISPASPQRQLTWRAPSSGSKPTALPPPP